MTPSLPQIASRTAVLAPELARLLSTADPALVDHLADDVTLRASGEAEWAGTHRGKDAVIGYLLELGAAFPDLTTEVIDTLVSDTRIACYLQISLRREGASVSDDSMWTFTLDEDGLIADWELNDFDQAAMDEFWARFPRTSA